MVYLIMGQLNSRNWSGFSSLQCKLNTGKLSLKVITILAPQLRIKSLSKQSSKEFDKIHAWHSGEIQVQN